MPIIKSISRFVGHGILFAIPLAPIVINAQETPKNSSAVTMPAELSHLSARPQITILEANQSGLSDKNHQYQLTKSQERFFTSFENLLNKTEWLIECNTHSDISEENLTDAEIRQLTITNKEVLQTITWSLNDQLPDLALKAGITESFKKRIPEKHAVTMMLLVEEFANSLVGDEITTGFRTEIIALKSSPPSLDLIPGELLNVRNILSSAERLALCCNLSSQETLNLVKALTLGDSDVISALVSKYPCEGRQKQLRDRLVDIINSHLESKGHPLLTIND